MLDRLAKHPGAVKARSYADKLTVLAPKRPYGYAILMMFASNARDTATLKALLDRESTP